MRMNVEIDCRERERERMKGGREGGEKVRQINRQKDKLTDRKKYRHTDR